MGLTRTEEPMNRWLILFFTILLTACTSTINLSEESRRADYPDLGAAPELVGDTWINVDAPLRIVDMRGKVILVDMWTFG